MSIVVHPVEETFIVAGSRDEWIKRCEESLRQSPDFRLVECSESLFRIAAQYRRPPLWGEIIVTLAPEESGATLITARAMTQPNLYTEMFEPEQRILDDFARAIGQRLDTTSEDAD